MQSLKQFNNMLLSKEKGNLVTVDEYIEIFKIAIIFSNLDFKDKKKTLINKMGFYYKGHAIVDKIMQAGICSFINLIQIWKMGNLKFI